MMTVLLEYISCSGQQKFHCILQITELFSDVFNITHVIVLPANTISRTHTHINKESCKIFFRTTRDIDK